MPTAKPSIADLMTDLRAHDAERAEKVKKIEIAQLEPLREVIALFDTVEFKAAIEQAKVLADSLSDARQGQVMQVVAALPYTVQFLMSEEQRIKASQVPTTQ